MSKRVCVIGGGISGLCVAHYLSDSGAQVQLYEEAERVGGNIRSEVRDGFLIEHGPNSTLTSPALIDLIHDLGIDDQIAKPNPDAKLRYIIRDGKLVALPSRVVGLLSTAAFSSRAKARLALEPFVRTRSADGESVAQFFERRFGREIVDYAVDPFISGIYAGDPEKLSVAHAFPRIVELERKFGSVTGGALLSRQDKASKLPKGAPRSLTFKSGMQTLTDSLSNTLGRKIRLDTAVTGIAMKNSDEIIVSAGVNQESYDAVIICTAVRPAAALVEALDSTLAIELLSIDCPPIAVVHTAFRSSDVGQDPRGFGFLVPRKENRAILGSLWTSSVFENRAPHGYHLFTTFIGGARNRDFVNAKDEVVLSTAIGELRQILEIDGEPVFTSITVWPYAIPQYNIGYESVTEAVDSFRAAYPGIFFCSNFYNGISVSDCVKNSRIAAHKVIAHIVG